MCVCMLVYVCLYAHMINMCMYKHTYVRVRMYVCIYECMDVHERASGGLYVAYVSRYFEMFIATDIPKKRKSF